MSKEITIELSEEELMIINNIMNEALGGAQPIVEVEFHTLIGATKDEATLLQQKIQAKYRTAFPPTAQT